MDNPVQNGASISHSLLPGLRVLDEGAAERLRKPETVDICQEAASDRPDCAITHGLTVAMSTQQDMHSK